MSRPVLFRGAAQIVTGVSASADQVLPPGAAILTVDGRIQAIGAEAELAATAPGAQVVDCSGRVLTPGLIDSHTHAVFGRWRDDEYALRCTGVSYMEIARRGGGINASVRDLRARTEDELVDLTRPRLERMLHLGTTTAEVKSGYGLSVEHELKMLRVIRRLDAELPIDLVPTLLGGHEVPPEYRSDPDAYVDLVVERMVPAAAEEGLAVFCDVFMEPGVFDADQSRRMLEAGLRHGLLPKLHADELEGSGAAELAAELGAASADHLGAVSEAGIATLARSDTVATLLPGTLFFLGRKGYAPARRLIDAGATIALATDFNPGSSPTPSLPLIMTIACSQMGLDPLEALVAATSGGARALRLDDGRATLRAGSAADLLVWSVTDYRQIPYRYGVDLVEQVWKKGTRIR